MRTLMIAALCLAACSGRSVLSTGESDLGGGGNDLGGTSKVCGGLRGSACAGGEYCHYPTSAACGAGDVTGSCLPRPQGCDKNYAPVCGCDYLTYDNACTANSAGIDVAHDGACETPNNSCGGFAGIACGADQYCDYPPASACGANDGSGTCKPRPQICSDVEAPVCGCDAQTYANACSANSVGVSVAHDGMCEGPADCRQTGCPSGQKCQLCWINYACLDSNVAC